MYGFSKFSGLLSDIEPFNCALIPKKKLLNNSALIPIINSTQTAESPLNSTASLDENWGCQNWSVA